MKVLLVDDHPVFRDGLAALLQQSGAEATVLQAGDVPAALALLAQHPDLDVIVLDLFMPGMGGLTAITEFGRARPELPVIVLSASEDSQDVRRALAQGALGYVPKSASQHTLLYAIQLVLNGDIYVPPLILAEEIAVAAAPAQRRIGANGSVLTDRQIDVLRRMSNGQTNKAIALELSLSEKTVKAHVTAIFKALNVLNRTQAAAAGREMGLI